LILLASQTLESEDFLQTLRGARWGYLIPSTLLNILTAGVIVTRWKTLLNHRARFTDCLAANQIGAYLNTLLPLRLGDFARSYILQRHVPELSKVAILTSIGAELTFDMLVLMVLLAGVLVVLPLPSLLTGAGTLLAIATVIAVVGVLTLARGDEIVDRFLGWLPERAEGFILGILHRMRDGLSSLRSNRQIGIVLLWTVSGYAIQVISNWLLLRAFLANVELSAGLVALVGAGLGLALPLLPGSTGTYELAVTLALTSLGIEAEAAAAFALVLHGQQVAITILMGSFFMLREGVSLGDLRRVAQQGT
jgi:uncharacterized protein (TIRG00374 family)